MPTRLTFEKILEIFILLVVLFIIFFAFFAPKGWLPKTAEHIKNFGGYLLGKDKDFKKTEIAIPKEVSEQFIALVNVFKNTNANIPCLIVYPELSAIKDNFKIQIQQDGNDLIFSLMGESGQEYDYRIVSGKKIGIVSGNNAAKNFYFNYLDYKNYLKEEQKIPDCNEKKMVVIFDVDTLNADNKKYSLYDKDLIGKQNEEKSLAGKPISLLFKRGNTLCFITTFRGDVGGLFGMGQCNADDEKGGLDNDCLSDKPQGLYHEIGIPIPEHLSTKSHRLSRCQEVKT